MVVSKALSPEEVFDYLEKGFIHCTSIIEIAGAPKEHVEKTLKDYVQKVKDDNNGIVIVKEELSDVKEAKGLFSTYADLEFVAKDASAIAFFCFDYMPSSIEIIAPESFTYRSVDFSAFFNDMAGRLHRIDKVVKELAARNKNLQRNGNMLLRNMVIITLAKSGPQSLAVLSKVAGIPKDQLQPFLEEMLKNKLLKREEGIFSLGEKKVEDDRGDAKKS